MASGPTQVGGPGRRKRCRNYGRGPGNIAGLWRVGRKRRPRAVRMAKMSRKARA